MEAVRRGVAEELGVEEAALLELGETVVDTLLDLLGVAVVEWEAEEVSEGVALGLVLGQAVAEGLGEACSVGVVEAQAETEGDCVGSRAVAVAPAEGVSTGEGVGRALEDRVGRGEAVPEVLGDGDDV